MPRLKKLPEIREDVNRTICALLGQWKSTKAIQQAIYRKFKLPTNPDHIARLQEDVRWQPMIQMARTTYLSGLLEIPIANKKIRLERLEEIYQTATVRGDLHLARAQLVAAREEMEEAKASQTNIFIHQQIATMDAAALERRRQEIVEQLRRLGGGHGFDPSRTALPDPEARTSLEGSRS